MAAVTINAAFAVGRGEDVGSIEGGKAADLVIWRVPTSRQIPYWPAADLVRTVVKRGRVVFERAWASRLAARLQEDRGRLGRQAGDRDRQARLGRGFAAHLVEEFRQRVAHLRRVVLERHRHDDLRVELRDEFAVLVAVSGPPIGTHAMSTEPMSASFSSVRR